MAISVAILKAARQGIRKTNLMSSASISYAQFIRYTEFLKAHGFIEEYGVKYQTTGKGLELIEEYESSSLIRSVLPA